MANLVTFLRFLLFFGLVGSAYSAPPAWQLINAPLVIVIIGLDAVDGHLARRRGEVSSFGAVFDIAVDRVVESVLWVVLADLDLVPVWVAIVFITRGAIVDSIRAQLLATHGITAFGAMRTEWGRFLVSGRFMRGLYGGIKAAAFAAVLFLQPLSALAPDFWAQWADRLNGVATLLVDAAVLICVARGVPVVAEAMIAAKETTAVVEPDQPRKRA